MDPKLGKGRDIRLRCEWVGCSRTPTVQLEYGQESDAHSVGQLVGAQSRSVQLCDDHAAQVRVTLTAGRLRSETPLR